MAVPLKMLLQTVVEREGSELYIGANTPPQIRIDGSFVALDLPSLTNSEVRELLTGYLADSQWAELEVGQPVTNGFTLKGVAQFRISAHMTLHGGIAATAKVVPWEISGFHELGLPEDLGRIPVGLTLIGGPRHSGRSSTLAATIDRINRETHVHITIFGPAGPAIPHQHKNSVVDQVVFNQTATGARRAAEVALWGSADIVAFDELYELEALRTMIHLAQTGIRVIGTAPAQHGVRDMVESIASLVPPFVRPSLQAELASVLRMAAVQQLLPKAVKRGRVPAFETLLVKDTARAAIEKGAFATLDRCVDDGYSMNTSLALLVAKNVVTQAAAEEASPDVQELAKALERARKTVAARRKGPSTQR